MANKRVTDNVHLLKGTFQPCRHGDPKKKPKVAIEYPKPPSWLSDVAKKEWGRIKQTIEKARYITLVDAVLLAQYCTLYATFVRDGEEFTAAQHTQLRLCAVELGFTPSARSRITVNNDKDDGKF